MLKVESPISPSNAFLDIHPDGTEVEKDRPAGAGAHAEHLQYAKAINHTGHRRKREELRREKTDEKYREAEVGWNIISLILENNNKVEEELSDFHATTVGQFMKLSVAKFKPFIHVRKFTGRTFQESKLRKGNQTLNKVLYRDMTAEAIEKDCNNDNPCLVRLAWSLRLNDLVLKIP